MWSVFQTVPGPPSFCVLRALLPRLEVLKIGLPPGQ
jgi:hypothetical protein